jgi:hypothetical protein
MTTFVHSRSEWTTLTWTTLTQYYLTRATDDRFFDYEVSQ